jgi:hypothetical protein
MPNLKLLWAAHKLPIILGGLLLVAGLALLLYLQGRSDGRAKIEGAIQKENVRVLERLGEANENASEARVADAEEVLELKEELVDAVEKTPDTLPTERRIARGCVQLRRAGHDTSAIPACRGH